MNPSNPTKTEMQQVEQLFFEQMRQQTRRATMNTRMSSLDFQFSDRWQVSP
jgi:hypothetical protein